MNITISIRGNPVTLEELKSDVIAAKEKGYNDRFAFTIETVEGLIEKIEELGNEILTLRSVIKRG